jgi:hypothetical protein
MSIINLATEKTLIREYVITSYKILEITVELNLRAKINLVLYNGDGLVVAYKSVFLEKELYLEWGNDDDFVTNYIEEQIMLMVNL